MGKASHERGEEVSRGNEERGEVRGRVPEGDEEKPIRSKVRGGGGVY